MEKEELVGRLANEIQVVSERLGRCRDYFYQVGFSRDAIDFPNSYSSVARILSHAIGIGEKINNNQAEKSTFNFKIVAQGQAAIDGTLHLIAEHLDGLFSRQKEIREQIQLLLDAKSGRVSRNGWAEKLSDEKDISDTIVFWKDLFHSILEKAQKLGFEVFKREAEQYKVYRTLQVSIREIVWEIQRQVVETNLNKSETICSISSVG